MVEFVGKVKSVRVDYEGTKNERVVLNVTKQGTSSVHTFWSFLPSTKWTKKIKEKDTVKLDYYKGSNGFFKVRDCEILNIKPSKNNDTNIISGVITSLNSVRGKAISSNYDVCFSLKYSKNKVAYCYASNSIKKSRWFVKGQLRTLEVIPLQVIDGHIQYEVINIWQ